jgi:hypothetical protein
MKPADDLTEDEKQHLEKMARMNLRPATLKGPPGASLYNPKWVFIILAAHGGLVLLENYDETDDPRWITMFGSGLPRDMRRIDMVFTAAAYHEKFKDFAIHIRGVEVQEQNPKRGEGAWLYTLTHHESGEQYRVHIWFIDIFLRNAQAHLIAYYTDADTADARFKQLTKRTGGVEIELMGHDMNDKASSILLIENDVLLTDMQSILDAAATAKHGGSQARASLSRDQIRKYSPADARANATLRNVLKNRKYKIISKYSPIDRLDILKSAFNDASPEILEALASYNTRDEIAMQLAMWEVAQVPIGTWKKDRLLDYLKESVELNKPKN